MKQVHALLEAADPDALVAAAKRDVSVIQLQGKSARLDEVWKTRDAMLVGLRGLSGKTTEGDLPSLHHAAISLLAHVHPAAAEPILVLLLASAAPTYLRASAAWSLTRMRSDQAVDALFDALHTPGEGVGAVYNSPVRRGAENALGQTGRADVGERALGLLTPKALEIPHARGAAKPTPEAWEKQDFVRAPLVILRELKYRAALPRLATILSKHPIADVQSLAAQAILAMATPEEMRGAFGDEAPELWRLSTAKRLLAYIERDKGG
jgi:HEAT repeat protein